MATHLSPKNQPALLQRVPDLEDRSTKQRLADFLRVRPRRSATPSFITEVPLIVDSKQEAELLSRFQAGRQLYNACLNEAMKRLELVRNSELYKDAKKIPRTKKKERGDAFKKARERYRYLEYDLHLVLCNQN